jgi:hypothetical protein
MRIYVRLLLSLVARALRSRNDLLMENRVLRQQFVVHARQRTKPQLTNEDRAFWSVVARTWRPWRIHLQLVQPDTVTRWHRTAWRLWGTKTLSARGLVALHGCLQTCA